MENNNNRIKLGLSAIGVGKKAIALAMISLLMAITIIYMLAPYGAAISPDSIFYMDIAAHIQQGTGLKSADYTLAHVGQKLSIANASWPPLYPILLAVTSLAAPSPASAATLSAILLAGTLFFLQLVFCRFLSWRMALLASLPMALTIPMLTIHAYAWSEQLFIFLLIILFWAAQTYLLLEEQQASRRKFLIGLVGLILTLGFYTRYIGIIYTPLLLLLYVFSGRPRNLLSTFVGSGIGAGTGIAALMLYNFQVSGSVTGAVRGGVKSSIEAQLDALTSALSPIFFLDFIRGPLIIALSMLVAVVLIYAASLRPPVGAHKRHTIVFLARSSFSAALYYVVCIVILSATVAFDKIDVRLISVIVPGLWIGCVAYFASIEKRLVKMVVGFVTTLAMVSMVMSGYLTLLDARKNWQKTGSPEFPMSSLGTYTNYNLPPPANGYRAFFARITNSGSVLVVDRPHIIQYVTGLTCVTRPVKLSYVDLQRLAELPERSYLIVPNSELQAVLSFFKEYDVFPEVTMASDFVLVHLPITLSSIKQSPI